MVYQVLALKWRPSGFDQVVAQDHVTQTLKNAITSDRIANAYLFTGPRGVGKTTTARIFAKALNCKEGPTPTPCNHCSNCLKIAAGQCLDVFEIDGASNRGIDEIRNLRENIRYAPSSSKFKIYIVDEVHMLTTEAFNALLKTLEEPPPHVRFIFATTEPHKVPATILSRCQRFDFKRIPLEQIIGQLKLICDKENIHADDESLLLVAKKADGSLRDAESLLDQLVSFCGPEIKVDEVLSAFSAVSQDLYFQLTDIILANDIREGLNFVENLISAGHDINEFLMGLIEHLRNILFSLATKDKNLLETSENYKTRYLDISGKFTQEDLLRMIQIVSDTEFMIKKSPNPRVKLEMCILSLLKMNRSVTLTQVIEQLSGLKSKTVASLEDKPSVERVNTQASQPAPVEAKESERKVSGKEEQKKKPDYLNQPYFSPSAPEIHESSPEVTEEFSAQPILTIDLFKTKWQEIIANVQKRRVFVSVFLKEGQPIQFSENTLKIEFHSENGFQLEAVKKSRDLIIQAIQDIVGSTVQLEFIKSDQAKKNREMIEESNIPHNHTPNQKKIDPKVKRLIDIFEGEILTNGGYHGKT